jgi:hypothetical protein
VIGVGVGSKVKAGKEDADGNLIANTDLTTWVAPISTPAEIRQYCEKLYDTVAALPFATMNKTMNSKTTGVNLMTTRCIVVY